MPAPFRFTAPKRRQSHIVQDEPAADDGASLEEAQITGSSGIVHGEQPALNASRFTHAELASLMWATDYIPILLYELEQHADVAVRARYLSAHSSFLTPLAVCLSGASAGAGVEHALASSRRAR